MHYGIYLCSFFSSITPNRASLSIFRKEHFTHSKHYLLGRKIYSLFGKSKFRISKLIYCRYELYLLSSNRTFENMKFALQAYEFLKII